MAVFDLNRNPALKPTERKNPAVALLLSLALPGLGHLYVRELQIGGLTLAAFALGVAQFVMMPPDPWLDPAAGPDVWAFVRLALVAFAFAHADAYYTAIEINRGEHKWLPENPRIAASLNLLGFGVGYWYLGSRLKAFIAMGGLSAIDQVAKWLIPEGSDGMAVFYELVAAALAIHAWRVAERMRRKTLAFAEPAPPVAAWGDSLSPYAPKVLAAGAGAVYLVVRYF